MLFSAATAGPPKLSAGVGLFRASLMASSTFRTAVARCSVVPVPAMCMKRIRGRSKEKWLCSAVTSRPFASAASIAGLTSSSASVMSPMTTVFAPLPVKAAQLVKPWKGLILTPSTVTVRSDRGTLTFPTPFFTSGWRPVTWAMTSVSGA